MASLKPAGHIEPIRDFETAESFGVGKLEEFTGNRSSTPTPARAAAAVRMAVRPIFPETSLAEETDPGPEDLLAWRRRRPRSPRKSGCVAAVDGTAKHLLADPRSCRCACRCRRPRGGAWGGAGREGARRRGRRSHELWPARTACTAWNTAPRRSSMCQDRPDAAVQGPHRSRFRARAPAHFPEHGEQLQPLGHRLAPSATGRKTSASRHWPKIPRWEYLFYVGCSGSFDDRGKKVSAPWRRSSKRRGSASAFSGPRGVLRRFGHARRKRVPLSDPCQANIEVMNSTMSGRSLQPVPRLQRPEEGLSEFRREFEVYHHTEILADLIAKGRSS